MNENLFNIEAEQSLLGSIILDSEVMKEITLKANDFYKEHHQEIFKSMMHLYKDRKPIDIIALIETLKKNNTLEAVGGISYITSLSTIVPTTSNAKYYEEIIKDKAQKRNVVLKAYELIRDIENGESINYSMDKFERLTDTKESVTEAIDIKSILQDVFDDMEKLATGIEVDRFLTGIPIIDKHTNGLGKGQLITIGANSGVGKSSLAMVITERLALEDKKILIISREMTKKQIVLRMLCSRSGISFEEYQSRNFTEKFWNKTIDAMAQLSDTKIFIDDKSSTIYDIQRQVRKYKPDLLIVDYVQLVTPTDDKASRERQVADLSRNLKNMTLDLDMTVIQLSQLAEKGSGNYRPHGESYTRESRAIYHDSNIVIYLHEVTEEKEIERAAEKNPRLGEIKKEYGIDGIKKIIENKKDEGYKFIEIIVDKNREGTTGSNYYWFDGGNLKYIPIA